MIILHSRHFRLRPIRLRDAASIARHAHDREIHRNTLNIPYPYTLRDAVAWIKRRRSDALRRPALNVVFGIEVDGQIVGAIGLHKIISGHKAELGYWLGRQFWGRGIMTEAVRMVVRYGFRTLKLQRVYAFTYLWNTGSQRVLLKAGFRREGTLRKNVIKGRRVLDDYIFSIIR
jgi:RimJ/RimL family protein N-acetyltransferase